MSTRNILKTYSGVLKRVVWRSATTCPEIPLHHHRAKSASAAITKLGEGVVSETPPPKKRKRKEVAKIRVTKTKGTPEEVLVKDISKYTSTAKAIVKYIDDNNVSKGLWQFFSRHDLKQVKISPKVVYLAVKDAAVKFADAIKSENPDLNSPVLELHPGIGLLTEELINYVGFKYVTCLEDQPSLRRGLMQRSNLPVIDVALDGIPRYHHLDKLDGGERIHNTILSKIKHDPRKKGDLHIVGALPSISNVNFLIRSMAMRKIFFEEDTPWSKVKLFVAFGPKVHLICTATPADGLIVYRASTILFNTLFKFKEIGTIPRKSFVPWEVFETSEVRKGPRKLKLNVKDPDNLHLYKIEVNEENVDKIGKENLFYYFYFVRNHLFARTNRVIPELEKWIPGCGPRLIKQGFTIFSQLGVLSPEEILDLYLQFVNWPEFTNSSFVNAVEKYQTRVEIPDDEEEVIGTGTSKDKNR